MKLSEADNMGAHELGHLKIEELRRIFLAYRKSMRYVMSDTDVTDALARLDPKSPVDWVVAIRSLTTDCDRCRGTGIYSWGACVNGKMEHSGSCFRCHGKGYLDNSDARRCFGYDNHAISRAFGF